MRLKLRGQRRGNVGTLHWLVEAHEHQIRRVGTAAAAIGIGTQEFDGRRREAERVGLAKRSAADGGRRPVHGHVVLGRKRQRRLRVRREDQDRRARPPERARNGRRNCDVWRPHDRRDPAERQPSARRRRCEFRSLQPGWPLRPSDRLRRQTSSCLPPLASARQPVPGRMTGDTPRAQDRCFIEDRVKRDRVWTCSVLRYWLRVAPYTWPGRRSRLYYLDTDEKNKAEGCRLKAEVSEMLM